MPHVSEHGSRVADIIHLHPTGMVWTPLRKQTFLRLAGAKRYLLKLPMLRTFEGQRRVIDRLIMCLVEMREDLLATRQAFTAEQLSGRLDATRDRLWSPMNDPYEMFAPGMPLTEDHTIAFVDTRTIKTVDPAA